MFTTQSQLDLSGVRDAVENYFAQAAYDDAAAVVIEKIKSRTQAGQSPQGSYPPYSAKYANRRVKKNLQTDHVDLRVSGGMQDSMYLTDDHWVSVDDSHEGQARGHQEGNPKKNLPQREWLSTDDEIDAAVTAVVEEGVSKLFQ